MGTTFRPTSLTFNGTTWMGSQQYNARDIPVPDYMLASGVDRTILEQQFAYEWFDSSSQYSLNHNPPFTKGSAGRLHPEFTDRGSPQRILRGFVRRADYDLADRKSTARLYFMYNPETITRDYLSYLDQGALDPFNTVYQAGNLVPPPSLMEFNFSLLFDRQEEAQDATNPGVFVDYEYFDLVVRNVVPNYDPNGTSLGGSDLPDNGVMMVNPRDITVVFSPNITVQGRPSNARVQFQKFTHRMIPTRMQIDLTIRATYFGPMKDMTEYKAETATVTDSVPWNITDTDPFTITSADIKNNAQFFFEQMKGGNLLTQEQIDSVMTTVLAGGSVTDSLKALATVNAGASGTLNQDLANWANTILSTEPTSYTDDPGKRGLLWKYSDCSSWIWGVFASHSSKANEKMGGVWAKGTWKPGTNMGSIPATTGMINDMPNRPVKELFKSRSTDQATRSKTILPSVGLLMPGDLLYRLAGVVKATGHVAMVFSNDSAGQKIKIIHSGGGNGKPASSPTYSYQEISTLYTEAYRPMIGNPDSPGNREGGD